MKNDSLLEMLSFTADKFNFWLIYNSIAAYYPIGVSKLNKKMYDSYPGQIALHALINEHIGNPENFKSHFKSFDKIVEDRLRLQPMGVTGYHPGFSSFVELHSESSGDLKITRSIFYFVSLLGPYYTVFGIEEYRKWLGTEEMFSSSYLVASPINEFAEVFERLCAEIENSFKDYRFVPHFIYHATLDALELPFSEQKTNRIFSAIFHPDFDLDIPVFGDRHYKSSDWIREDYTGNGGYTSYPSGWMPKN